jgi:hypothetical protein
MKMNTDFEKFKQLYRLLICEGDIPGYLNAEEAQYIVDHPANKEIIKTFDRFFQRKLQKLNKHYGLNAKIEYELFEPYDQEDLDEGGNFAHVNENEPLKILINLYWLGNYIDEDMTAEQCINEYNKNNILEHEYAHVLDILENGKRPFEEQHNERWKELFEEILNLKL